MSEANEDSPASESRESPAAAPPGVTPAGSAGPPTQPRPAEAVESAADHRHREGKRYLALLSLTALGVVYGDIGTSPLYAMRECFSGHHPVEATASNIFGVLSLIFWALIILISTQYLMFVVRADNRGEGGILAITSLVTPLREPRTSGVSRVLIVLGLFGAALLYGDGMITPAISVLSAVEGLKVATPAFGPYVIPTTVAIIFGLFFFQSHGTGKVGLVFGPITLLWFIVIAGLGIAQIVQQPQVLRAINPYHAVRFFQENQIRGFFTLGSVFLVVTGGEALYADMGHFGVKPIRLMWFTVVLPSLLLNYFGQGALLLADSTAATNPFYGLAPKWALVPLVILATMATVIASQALISGAYSLTMQAVQLGYCPRLNIRHTSAREMGQIYLPGVNWTLMICAIWLVLEFKDSSSLAAAYGIAVCTTMVITTIMLFFVAWKRWGWGLLAASALVVCFLPIVFAFFVANLFKIPHGGWFALMVAAIVFTLLTTWKRGRWLVARRLQKGTLAFDKFREAILKDPPVRVPGTAVFMYSNAEGTPPALLHNLKHNKVLHRQVVVLCVTTLEVPHVSSEDRLSVQDLGEGFYRVTVCYGFMEDPDIPAALKLLPPDQLTLNTAETTYFLGRENLIASAKPGMVRWREKLFAWMSRNALGPTMFFRLPPNRVVELGAQVEL